MELLRAGYTEVWIPSRQIPLIRFADRVRGIASTGIELVGITEPAIPAFDEFDSIVSWYGSNRPDFREAVAHLPFIFLPALPDGSCHAVDFYTRQAGGKDGAAPRLNVPRRDDGWLAIHPFSGSARKNWPIDRYRELAVSAGIEARFCEDPEGVHRMGDLAELAERLATARAYVGNDSGISHLAAAVGTPVVALFGPSDPRMWAPRGPWVRVLHCDPISDIGVDEVLDCLRCVL